MEYEGGRMLQLAVYCIPSLPDRYHYYGFGTVLLGHVVSLTKSRGHHNALPLPSNPYHVCLDKDACGETKAVCGGLMADLTCHMSAVMSHVCCDVTCAPLEEVRARIMGRLYL